MSIITPYEFFYDAQQKRFLEQVVRAFSGFQYETGMQGGAAPQLLMVPCHMALTNQMIANIRANGSENALNTVPMITVWQTGLVGRIADLQNPAHVDHRQVFEREIVDGKYGTKIGNTYSVDRIMPLPFIMNVQVDVWTSNMDQKLQLIEQICTVMYPQFEIQNSDNALDWTAISICFIEDDMEFSSRTMPVGTASTNDNLDIFTMKLRIPFYLTAPAKIRKLVRIEQVVANVGDLVVDPTGARTIGTLFQQVIVTPGDHFISVDANVITLLNGEGGTVMSDGTMPSWRKLFDLYGAFSPMMSELRLYLSPNIEADFVSGTLQYGGEPNELIWTIDADTLPGNTLLPVDAVIDPLRSYPRQAVLNPTITTPSLPVATDGTRYMLINDIGNSFAWGNLTASANDIIQYSTALGWTVVFNSRALPQTQFVLNLHTGRQLRWTGRDWQMSIDNFYSPGHWRLFL